MHTIRKSIGSAYKQKNMSIMSLLLLP